VPTSSFPAAGLIGWLTATDGVEKKSGKGPSPHLYEAKGPFPSLRKFLNNRELPIHHLLLIARRKVECQCVSTVAFARSEPELLDSPIWIMLINVVALEMLKAKMPSDGKANGPGE